MKRTTIFGAVLLLACGPMQRTEPSPHQPVAQEQAGPPGGAADPWQVQPSAQEPVVAAAPAPKAPPPPKPAVSPSGPAEVIVDAHNRYREKHCAPPLTWSPKIAEVAQTWADSLKAKGCAFGHSNNNKYGENLAAGTTGALPPEAVVAMWYDEVAKYSFKKPGFSMETGHFTQVVWTTTTEVGCGMAQCKGMDIWVCNYAPPGNWEGRYKEHVLPTSCKK
ncbi:MAG: CAP family protein [Kofleriaceae bacterium]|nr:CAP family protein [Kofleriaceae bacterium]